MAYRPDSDSDSCFSDDPDYDDFKHRIKGRDKPFNNSEPVVLTESQKKEQFNQQLYKAIYSGNIQQVQCMLDEAECDVNAALYDKWTPLLLSVSFGNFELTNEFVKRGANVNSDRDSYTALMMACNCPKLTAPYSESLKIIKQLVEKGANVKVINNKRMTALMVAACNGHLEAVRFLLPLSNKSAVDNQGWNALFWAVSSNELEVVKYLLDEGLDFNITDVRGNTALDIAKNSDFIEIVDLFPKDEEEAIFDVVKSRALAFEDSFGSANKRPEFFIDICNILCGIKSESLMKVFADKNITLGDFLSLTDKELEQLGVRLPYQRKRVLGALYRFHQHPYHPKSLHVIPLHEKYSNLDVAIQVLGTIKQVIAMEASIDFILKNCYDDTPFQKDDGEMVRYIRSVKNNIALCKLGVTRLSKRAKKWDRCVEPADLITKDSRRWRMPWRKIVLTVTLCSIVMAFRVLKK